MNYIAVAVLILSIMNTETIFNFDKKSKLTSWRVVDDVVMGGRSNGSFSLSAEGHGVFEGEVSLENNGGFSSVRYFFEKTTVNPEGKLKIRLKGDGKRYQIRIKDNSSAYYSYVAYFQTSGKWETIEIPLSEMYAAFRGRKLNMPNFSKDSIEQIGFLISNKQAESFCLLLDKITVDS